MPCGNISSSPTLNVPSNGKRSSDPSKVSCYSGSSSRRPSDSSCECRERASPARKAPPPHPPPHAPACAKVSTGRYPRRVQCCHISGPFLNAVYFLTGKVNKVINPIFELLSSRAIHNIPDMLSYLLWFLS